ncbi:MAG: ribonuclease R [Thermoanaerobacterales bacterium]|nr:ribonuclease R [Thermoanaerobacterales bacterium]
MKRKKGQWNMPLKEKLLEFMREKAYKPVTDLELIQALNIDMEEADLFLKTLCHMEKDGLVVKNRRGRYGIPERMNLIVGTLEGHPGGYAFLIAESQDEEDVYISRENTNGALHGDRVIVRPKIRVKGDAKREGEVIRILRRAKKKVVGTLEKGKNFSFVIPDDKRFFYDIYVPRENTSGAKTGQKVVVRITNWPERRRNPEGEIIEVLGYQDDPGMDIISIIKKYDLRLDFPGRVKNQLEKIPDEVSEDDQNGREDFRAKRVITIDGEDAKDLDDAVSIESLSDGYRLGVHIADVSYYVKEKSPIDIEAMKRGCSVYLVDRAIPMLPPKLSNGICSLNPNTVRLTMSIIIDFDAAAKIKSYRITPGIIKSCERMNYTEVTSILEGKSPDLIKRYGYLIKDLELMRELAEKLSRNRINRGSIEFNIEEAKVILDDNGYPINVIKEKRAISHRIIEEFMLSANQIIAEHMYWLKIRFVYRIHEVPDEEKMLALEEFLYNLGYSIKGVRNIKPKTLQQIIEKAKGKPEEKLINTVLLRSLKRARYSEQNAGHFGLAAGFYTHFTAPIRRYPDLIIHRIIREHLEGRLDSARQKKLNKILSKMAKIASERERIAEEAERETVELKIAEYMAERVGNIYNGVISGITPFGIFIELDNTVEGLIHVSNMEDDYYTFDEKTVTLKGEGTGKVYQIGDAAEVKVIKVNISERQIDFAFVNG